MTIAHFGTFDVENYGDLLFPLILEKRLGDLGRPFLHVSPRGGPPVWGDCVATVSAENLLQDAVNISAVVVGGGHIVHASPTRLDHYDQGGVSAIVAYPSLWLGAAYIAAQRNAPLCWNAPGVPKAFTPTAARLVRWAASVADYLAVRDRASRAWLAEAGVTEPIHVVPDTAIEVSGLWTEKEVDAAFTDAFAGRGRTVPDRTLAVHLNSRFIAEGAESLAARLDRICQRHGATAILIAIGPCHGDGELQRQVARHMTTEPLVIDQPQSLREVAACIARSDAYLGSSLHGIITACSFGKPGLAVVPRTAGTHHKFVGFLEPFQLTRWVCESWEHAEQGTDELLTAPIGAWQRVLPSAMTMLDQHWGRLRDAISAQNEVSQRVDKQTALAQFQAWHSGHLARASVFGDVIFEEAHRAQEASKTAEEYRRKATEASTAYDRLRQEVTAIERATEHDRQRAVEQATTRTIELSALHRRLDWSEWRLRRARRRDAVRRVAHRAERAGVRRTLAGLEARIHRLADADAAHRAEKEVLERLLVDERDANRREQADLRRELAELAAARRAEQEELLQWLADEEAAHQAEREDLQRQLHEAETAVRAEQELAARRLAEVEAERRQSEEHLEALRRRLGEVESAHEAEMEALRQRLDDANRRRDEKESIAPMVAPAGQPQPGNGRASASATSVAAQAGDADREAVAADIVICVHNALDDLKLCLASLIQYTTPAHRVIIVDDGSDAECRDYLAASARAHPNWLLLRNDQAHGYTKAANQGLRHASAGFVVLLNSDTIVTPHWLERLIECAESDPRIGIIGPLSNAAGYQSIPERFTPDGGWALNPLPPGWAAEHVAFAVSMVSTRGFPRVPIVNGFCFAIKPAVIDAVGSFDEDAFPEGYGEEYDYCFRATAAGFELAVADHAYVFHAKSRSYTSERRRRLVEAGNAVLFRRYGRERIEEAISRLRDEPTLATMRRSIARYLRETSPPPQNAFTHSLSMSSQEPPPSVAPADVQHVPDRSPHPADGRMTADTASLRAGGGDLAAMVGELRASNAEVGALRRQLAALTVGPGASALQSGEPTASLSGRDMERELQEILLRLCDQLLNRTDVLESIITSVESSTPGRRRSSFQADSAAGSNVLRDGPVRSSEGGPATVRRDVHNGRSRGSKPRVTVFAWDVAHNPLGRAYLLADMLRDEYDVELVGARFPRYGTGIWEPLRDANVPIVDFLGHQFPHHFTVMQRIVERLSTDVILVSKPRLPSYELGMLTKLRQPCPLILDIDDYELSFFRERTPLALEQVKESPRNEDFYCPFGNLWTRYCESIVPLADSITVSSDALQGKYGGLVVPHARDERVFDPTLYDRDAMRARYGYGPGDRVILFLGTPRSHKGVMEVVSALQRLGESRYKLCIIGNVVDRDLERRLKSEGGSFLQLLPNVGFADLPAHLVIGDLVCLLQNRTDEVAKYQTPAKFTDALAMAIPVLATEAGPLANLAARGLVEPLGATPLEQKIHNIFMEYDSFKHRAVQNRATFLSEYSYAANRSRLQHIIEGAGGASNPTPEEYEALVAFHRAEFMPSQERIGRQADLEASRPGGR